MTGHMICRRRAGLLCVFLYEFPDPESQRNPGDTGRRNIVSLLYVFSYVSSGSLLGQKSFHTEHKSKAFLRSGFYCVYSGYQTGRRTCHRRSRRRAYLLCVSSGDYSGYSTARKPGNTGGRNKVSVRCVFAGVSLRYLM